MKGDFSRWSFDAADNFSGVLHQQGRVSLDWDHNTAVQIAGLWEKTMGRDAVGADLAAVPATASSSFKVVQAHGDGTGVDITLQPGRVWADGVHLYLAGSAPLALRATYLGPPIQTPQASAASIAAGIRDAVILEVWEEAFSSFQDPAHLLEPALGGPDTTERIKVASILRLLRLEAGDDCGNLAGKLTDNFGAKGKLTVTPAPSVVIAGDCPVEAGGGYTGFEHYLYRIEIAEPKAGQARFKWSQFNGGLVGRGDFDSVASTVDITANDQAINHCGLTEFYLEALRFNPNLNHWEIFFAADATLTADSLLSLTLDWGIWPTVGTPTFFRLWHEVKLITDFPTGLVTPNELKDGILLAFEAPTAGNANYTPGDYWTFPVRAAGVPFDPTLWPTNAPPEGVHYHRVPLAILNWDGVPTVTITAADGKISDCRHIFQPLARLNTCCSYRVGDGMTSFGDFDSIQQAINQLPPEGGEICVLPGTFTENITISGKQNVTIHGCGSRSKIISAAPSGGGTADPVITISDSQSIRVDSLVLVADDTGVGILITGNDPVCSDIALTGLEIQAATRSAIQVDEGQFITIRHCRIMMKDVAGPWPGIFVIGEDVLIEENLITVQPGQQAVTAGRGGLQLGGTSERVRVINNLIQQGIGNGITLGSLEVEGGGEGDGGDIPWVEDPDDPCNPCAPGTVYIPVPTEGEEGPRYRSAGALHQILIEENRIFDMGLNGIGVVGFFNLDAADEFITVERLTIIGNDIRRCLQRPLAVIPVEMIDSMGYGGISLADVEYLVVRDNVIEDNGPDHLEPICGIFVLHGEGLEISRNRILNNGKKTSQPAHMAKDGRRGGINVVFGVAKTIPVTIDTTQYPRQDGVPAIKVHDNIVSQPLGQALALTALGPVSVVGNQFTSRGMILKFSPISPSFLASTVVIWNLGLSDEWVWLFPSFIGIATNAVNSAGVGPFTTSDAVVIPRKGLDDERLGRYLANGNVLFSDNQCVLDLLETGVSWSLSSIFIGTLDDIGFHNNQCDCSLRDDFVLVQAILFGISVRVSDNRFKEGVMNALYSLMSLGLMNATTNNQSTHCILVHGLPALKVETGNRALVDAFISGFCERTKAGLDSAGVLI